MVLSRLMETILHHFLPSLFRASRSPFNIVSRKEACAHMFE
jgi:hypothetical protein